MKWSTFCIRTIHPLIFYCGQHSLPFLKIYYKFIGQKILYPVKFMVRIHPTSSTVNDIVHFFLFLFFLKLILILFLFIFIFTLISLLSFMLFRKIILNNNYF
jgi:hypothetical protein